MDLPKYIIEIIEDLQKVGHQAYLVGGCVRDILLNKKPQDWDITTSARPEEILKVFPEAKYKNKFGTVLYPVREKKEKNKEEKNNKQKKQENNDDSISSSLSVIDLVEITTYRSEQGYNDRRHPDSIKFETELDKDLERRDFTINALALDPHKPQEIIDLFGGQKDLKLKIIRSVGEPSDRFKEDALRMLRAIRFSVQLGFKLEAKTQRAISKLAGSLKFISSERIRDELIKIISSPRPSEGIILLHQTKLLQYILPELEQGVGVKQDRHHIYTVFKHNVLSLKYCPSTDWVVRFAALLHDIGKPKTRRIIKGIATFYNHEYLGAKMADKIMKRLKFSNEERSRVVNLVRNHMFYYNVGEVSASSVRRLIVKVGKNNLKDLIDLRIADRLGSGTPKAKPYKLRHLEYMLEKVQHDPISAKMLKINGDDLIKLLNLDPGPKIGAILDVLLSQIINDPKLNTFKYLKIEAKKLSKLNLEDLRKKAQKLISEKQIEEDQKIKRQHHVS